MTVLVYKIFFDNLDGPGERGAEIDISLITDVEETIFTEDIRTKSNCTFYYIAFVVKKDNLDLMSISDPIHQLNKEEYKKEEDKEAGFLTFANEHKIDYNIEEVQRYCFNQENENKDDKEKDKSEHSDPNLNTVSNTDASEDEKKQTKEYKEALEPFENKTNRLVFVKKYDSTQEDNLVLQGDMIISSKDSIQKIKAKVYQLFYKKESGVQTQLDQNKNIDGSKISLKDIQLYHEIHRKRAGKCKIVKVTTKEDIDTYCDSGSILIFCISHDQDQLAKLQSYYKRITQTKYIPIWVKKNGYFDAHITIRPKSKKQSVKNR